MGGGLVLEFENYYGLCFRVVVVGGWVCWWVDGWFGWLVLEDDNKTCLCLRLWWVVGWVVWWMGGGV